MSLSRFELRKWNSRFGEVTVSPDKNCQHCEGCGLVPTTSPNGTRVLKPCPACRRVASQPNETSKADTLRKPVAAVGASA